MTDPQILASIRLSCESTTAMLIVQIGLDIKSFIEDSNVGMNLSFISLSAQVCEKTRTSVGNLLRFPQSIKPIFDLFERQLPSILVY